MQDILTTSLRSVYAMLPVIHDTTDMAMKLFAVHEDKFDELRLGIIARCFIEESEGSQWWLAYEYLKSKGTLSFHVVQVVDDGDGPEETRIPMPSVRREMKLKAFLKLPELLHKIEERGQEMIRLASEAEKLLTGNVSHK